MQDYALTPKKSVIYGAEEVYAQPGGAEKVRAAAIIPSELTELEAEVERCQKIAHVLADKLTPVLRAGELAKGNLPNPIFAVPLADRIATVRIHVTETANLLMSLLERTEL